MRHGISFFMISFSSGFCLFFGFSYFKSWFLSDWISRFSETFETLVIRDFITRFSRHSMTQFLGALTWFSSFTLSCTGRNNYFQLSVKSGIHFIIVPTQGWLHGLHRLFRFTQHSVNFGRKNLWHIFTFDLHPNPHISPVVKLQFKTITLLAMKWDPPLGCSRWIWRPIAISTSY